MVSKICSKCRIEKPITSFHKLSVRSKNKIFFARRPDCAKCRNDYEVARVRRQEVLTGMKLTPYLRLSRRERNRRIKAGMKRLDRRLVG